MSKGFSHSVCALAAAACFFAGCALKHPVASIKQTAGQKPTLELQGTVVPGANADSPIPFDVVVIHDKSMLKQIAKMDATAWFGEKGRCTYRGGPKAKVEFHSWEFVPGQSFTLRVPVPAGADAVFGFANYAARAPHRIELPNSGTQKILLDNEGITVTGKGDSHAAGDFAPEVQKVCPDD